MLSALVIVGHGVFPPIKIPNRQDTYEVTLDGQPRGMVYLSFHGVIYGKNQVFRFFALAGQVQMYILGALNYLGLSACLPLRAKFRWISWKLLTTYVYPQVGSCRPAFQDFCPCGPGSSSRDSHLDKYTESF